MTHRAHQVLVAEVAAIGEVLQSANVDEFGNDTPLPGWSVRDVIAHCGAALTRLREQDLHGFTPEDNEADVVARRSWDLDDVVTEYLEGLDDFAAMSDAAPAALDGLARGMWIHGGDIRAGLGREDAYCSAGLDDALALIDDGFEQRGLPAVRVALGGESRVFGGGEPEAVITCSPAAFVRLVCGREPDPAAYEAAGVDLDALKITG